MTATVKPEHAAGGGFVVGLLTLLAGVFNYPHMVAGTQGHAISYGSGIVILSVLGFIAHKLGIGHAEIARADSWYTAHRSDVESVLSKVDSLPFVQKAVADANVAVHNLQTQLDGLETHVGLPSDFDKLVEDKVLSFLTSLGKQQSAAPPTAAGAAQS